MLLFAVAIVGVGGPALVFFGCDIDINVQASIDSFEISDRTASVLSLCRRSGSIGFDIATALFGKQFF